MRFLIIFIFLISNSFANDISGLKNIIIHKDPKIYEDLTFLDVKNKEIKLEDYKTNLIILNFWATWCAPCKKEMPSLDNLLTLKDLDNLKIFAINVGQDSVEKSLNFFEELKIQELEIYFDSPNTLAKKFELRGIPTTIVLNKSGKEFARIIGSIDFKDENFIKWLSKYN